MVYQGSGYMFKQTTKFFDNTIKIKVQDMDCIVY